MCDDSWLNGPYQYRGARKLGRGILTGAGKGLAFSRQSSFITGLSGCPPTKPAAGAALANHLQVPGRRGTSRDDARLVVAMVGSGQANGNQANETGSPRAVSDSWNGITPGSRGRFI